MISQDRVDELWDFDDPAGSEHRFRAAADRAPAEDRPEYQTLVARALGLQQRFTEARAVLDEIHPEQATPVVAVRIALERGRLENSGGRPDHAVPHLMAAAELAGRNGLEFLRIDALHMLAITDRDREQQWTAEGLREAGAATDPRTRQWTVALHNNHGWTLYDGGDYPGAVRAFEHALAWAERVAGPTQQRYAREALAEARAALDRR